MANEKTNGDKAGTTADETPATGCTQRPNVGDGNQENNVQGEKSAAQLRKEAAKKAKLEKFNQKKEKLQQQQQQSSVAGSKAKDAKIEKKEKTILLYEKSTPSGDKKDVSGSMPESYSPRYVEAAWYEWWEKSGFFKPEINCPDLSQENPKGQFVIVIPPPNVTGTLHLGHALTSAVEDAVVRWHRMHGKTTLWAPGCDHAGIATQVVVEKTLAKQGISRHQLGREEFVNRVWEWKNEKGNRIYDQIRKLGSSVDWTRTTFTMDPKMSNAVVEAFITLFDRGLIYRANRLVNWSCVLKSAISDIEVDKMEIPGRTMLSVPGYQEKIEFGVLILFAYKIEGMDEEIVVATTRIETMLGDTAIAVHPDDTRYSKLHGKYAIHPFCDRKLPIVCDDFVDREFGTGAVKITPAHDPNDFEVGKRHDLPFINIFTDDGNVAEGFAQFSGMKRFDARKAVLKALEEKGLYRKTEDNPMHVPICSRSKDIVEPMLKYQWYINCQEMGRKAVEAVRSGELKLIPDLHNKTWYYFMENIRDWCISRQLWWGHRIPTYKVTSCKSKDISDVQENDLWFAARSEDDAKERASKKFQVTPDSITVEQDEDVLDTWFSSALFPFAVFGWPNRSIDLQKFYPGNLLETGYDILFFWVSKMVMLGQELMGCLPFKEVFLHPIVRDAHGRKMSKSLGNIIDPLDVIFGISLDDLHAKLFDGNLDPKEVEKAKSGQKRDFPDGIPECGTDALRFSLCAYLTQGRDINLDIKRIEGYRFFCNKLWNAMKLTFMSLGSDFRPTESENVLTGHESAIDSWLLSRVAYAADQCHQGFTKYDFPMATTACYNLWLYDYCDVYLEVIKSIMASGDENVKNAIRQTIYTTTSIGLRLLHPFMPFITEELYQRLPRRASEGNLHSICVSQYPVTSSFGWTRNETLEKDMNFAQEIVHNIRALRAEYNLAKNKVRISIKCDTEEARNSARSFLSVVQALCLASEIDLFPGSSAPADVAVVPVNDVCEAYLYIKGVIDVDKEVERLKGKMSKLEGPLTKLRDFMATSDYGSKVPADIQEQNSQKLKSYEAEMKRVEDALEGIKKMSLN